MITNEMLTIACAELSNAMVKSLSDLTEPEHTFSASFRRKMERLVRRVEHPVRHRAKQIAASLLLALFIGFATLMAVSPTARAAVVGWVREKVEDWFSYSYVGESVPNTEFVEYYISALPEEYEEISTSKIDNRYKGCYVNAENKAITFYYSLTASLDNVFIEDYATLVDTEVNGIPAQMFFSDTTGEVPIILWSDEKTGTVFYISAEMPESELIDLAESVKKLARNE